MADGVVAWSATLYENGSVRRRAPSRSAASRWAAPSAERNVQPMPAASHSLTRLRGLVVALGATTLAVAGALVAPPLAGRRRGRGGGVTTAWPPAWR